MIALTLAAALASAPDRDTRSRELLSSVIISGTCSHGCIGERRLFGTGEIVGRRSDGRLVVLTAAHVVADMSDPRVYVRNDAPEGTRIAVAVHERQGIVADVLARSPASDLALLLFRPAANDAYGVATFASNASVRSGNVVGGPYGALWTVSPYRAIPHSGDATLVSCKTCGPGDSGGGVFDRRGSLKGILVSQQLLVRDDEPLAFAKRSTRFKIVPLGDVRTFVASLAPEAPPLPVAMDDPWARFDSTEASPGNGRPDPWRRFNAPGDEAAGP